MARKIVEKAPDALRTIGEVSKEISVAQHVLRFWEAKIPQLKPTKRNGRRYYRPGDIALLYKIKHLLYEKGLTIRGVSVALRESLAKGNKNLREKKTSLAKGEIQNGLSSQKVQDVLSDLLADLHKIKKLHHAQSQIRYS